VVGVTFFIVAATTLMAAADIATLSEALFLETKMRFLSIYYIFVDVITIAYKII